MAGIVLEDNCHLLPRIPRFGSQTAFFRGGRITRFGNASQSQKFFWQARFQAKRGGALRTGSVADRCKYLLRIHLTFSSAHLISGVPTSSARLTSGLNFGVGRPCINSGVAPSSRYQSGPGCQRVAGVVTSCSPGGQLTPAHPNMADCSNAAPVIFCPEKPESLDHPSENATSENPSPRVRKRSPASAGGFPRPD
jgi:hypothetical protein